MALVASRSTRAQCPDPGDTCVEGHCKSAIVDVRTLPAYASGFEAQVDRESRACIGALATAKRPCGSVTARQRFRRCLRHTLRDS